MIGHKFSEDELMKILPEDIYKFMCLKLFNKEDPDLQDKPELARLETVAFYKKAISYFMPNHTPNWCVKNKCGNPTKSAIVNDLFRFVRQQQVKGKGAESKKVREFKVSEIEGILRLYRNMDHHKDKLKKYSFPAYLVYQFNMIARTDDVSKLYGYLPTLHC